MRLEICSEAWVEWGEDGDTHKSLYESEVFLGTQSSRRSKIWLFLGYSGKMGLDCVLYKGLLVFSL